jgi:HEAT repeat protein
MIGKLAFRWLGALTLLAALGPQLDGAFLWAANSSSPAADLEQAIAAAQQSRRPILAIVGGAACPHCRTLEQELQKEDARQELSRWTVAVLDVDRSPDDAARLLVRAIPALRILTPAGQLIAAREGALPSPELVAWLRAHFTAASGAASPELTAPGELTALAAVRLARELGRRDATAREAAIRRLLARPAVAAPPVAAAFADGPLAARLAALEILETWKAPVAGLDPWRPETITRERLEAIAAWVADPAGISPAASPAELSNALRQSIAEWMRQMLAAPPAEATAIRERLARQGRLLLPLVYDQLRAAETDDARQRLTALRYRLVAADELVLTWPGGIERLAAADPQTRHQAMDELARRATAADEPLLLELFSDPEPLVRELSLRALYQAGGTKANSALVRLLDDPEPNVRAAVLKQLAEAPARAIVPRLAAYVAQEQDPDLLVHAVRVLRETKGKAAGECLMTLLKHENWRVRAEAAEAVGEAVGGSNSISDDEKVDVYVALVELLQDDDPFVVSRAVQVLGKANLATAVNPLAEVAARHPALAVEVVKALTHSGSLQAKVTEHLRRFAGSQDPKVRAAAVKGLCELNVGPLGKELGTALADEIAAVRIAAAEGLIAIMVRQASVWQSEPESGKAGEKSNAAETDLATLPRWMQTLVEPLRKMLTGKEAEERIAAAIPFAALGQPDQALPVLRTAVQADRGKTPVAATVLRWLPWQERRQFFGELVSAARGTDDLAKLATELAHQPQAGAADLLWDLLARPDAAGPLAAEIVQAVRGLYLGDRWYDLDAAPKRQVAAAIADARKRAATGPRWQRLAALSLLGYLEPAAAVEMATPMAEDQQLDPRLRAAAVQVRLFAAEQPAAEQAALVALASSEPQLQKLALAYLAQGKESLQLLADEGLELLEPSYSRVRGGASEQAIPEPPAGLTAKMLNPHLLQGEPRQRAQAGYLLCLMGEEQGLTPLIDYWNELGRKDEELTRMVYRSIAALNATAQVPLLTEIYRRLRGAESGNEREVAAFYWTIRAMTGPEALALRKRIRDDVGIEELQRNNPFGN